VIFLNGFQNRFGETRCSSAEKLNPPKITEVTESRRKKAFANLLKVIFLNGFKNEFGETRCFRRRSAGD
jgi:hypothetical protein